jgi:hypothetical protein
LKSKFQTPNLVGQPEFGDFEPNSNLGGQIMDQLEEEKPWKNILGAQSKK